MKGPFSIWSFFGITLWIDLITLALWKVSGKKDSHIDPYRNKKEISVLIPVHDEEKNHVIKTVESIYKESYPVKNVIICADAFSAGSKEAYLELAPGRGNLLFYESNYNSKARKVNGVVNEWHDLLGEIVYIRDCKVRGEKDCMEKLVSYFDRENVAAVTSYGRVSVPENFLSKSYFWGKAWINEIGKIRKKAQERRKSIFVICGASTMFRKEVIRKVPIPYGSKTEDTYYTWVLQNRGYEIRVANDAIVSAPEVDGRGIEGLSGQIRQSYRWSSGTIQCMYREGKGIFRNKRLFYSTIAPGFIESTMYAVSLVILPLLLLFFWEFAIGFIIGDTLFSLLGTLVFIPNKFPKTLIHYPQIFFFKYINALIFLSALGVVTYQGLVGKTERWANEWTIQDTGFQTGV